VHLRRLIRPDSPRAIVLAEKGVALEAEKGMRCFPVIYAPGPPLAIFVTTVKFPDTLLV
jgi:hypothetical protein